MRYMLTDDLWAAMAPVVEAAKRHKGGQRPGLPERGFFEALLYLARTGIPWRDLPGEFGRWDAVYNRFRRWIASGALRRLFEAMTDNPDFAAGRRGWGGSSSGPRPPPAPRPPRAEKKDRWGGRPRPPRG